MPYQRSIQAWLVMVLLVLPATVRSGVFYIDAEGSGYGSPCWCDAAWPTQLWGWPLVYKPATRGECDVVSVAFRLEGVPDDPALGRRFESAQGASVTGDPFGEGAVVRGLVYEGIIGFIRLTITAPLPPQVWSIEAHGGIPGSALPVAAFEGAPESWVAQSAYSSRLGSENPQCAACADLGPWEECPFAVEPEAWSMVKHMYR